MKYRVLIAGSRGFTDYAKLRAALDALLVNRLPGVELLTQGGPGVPMLAASYASERGLSVVALLPNFDRFPANAEERRDKLLVEDADVAVIVVGAHDAKAAGLVALCRAKGIPVHILDGPGVVRVRRVVNDEDEPARRGLPD